MNNKVDEVEAYHQELDRVLLCRIAFEQKRHHGGFTSKEYLSAVIDVVEKVRIVAHGVARKHGANYGPTSLAFEKTAITIDLPAGDNWIATFGVDEPDEVLVHSEIEHNQKI